MTKYYIERDGEKLEVGENEYYQTKEKVFRIKLLAMVDIGKDPLTPFRTLSKFQQRRYLESINEYMKLPFDEIVDITQDIVEDVFRQDPKDLPINRLAGIPEEHIESQPEFDSKPDYIQV